MKLWNAIEETFSTSLHFLNHRLSNFETHGADARQGTPWKHPGQVISYQFMLHIAPTVNLKSPIKLTGWKSEYPEMTGSWRKLRKFSQKRDIILKKHKSSSKMSVFVTLIKISPDVRSNQCRNPGHSKGFTNFLLYCSDCCTIIYVWRTDDLSFIYQLHVYVVLQWKFVSNKTPDCVLFTHHFVLTPTILPFQLNRQYISGRHVSLPMHPFI